jgi:hypothetical protein
MMFKKSIYLSLLLSGFVFIGAASADQSLAEIKGVKGQVMLDDGTQYVLAEEGQTLLPGTSVLVPSSGAGSLVFNDCTIKLKPNTVTIVPDNADCKGVVVKAYNEVAAPGVQASKTSLPSWLLPTAGVVAIGGVAAAIASSGGSSNKSDASAQ